jgi:D-alanyl-D-alanine carboxypeptidase (penicillin-binding protein 5/6)
VFELLEAHPELRRDGAITVSRFAARIIGTSAKLREGDRLTINDLLYGMMLPSGNDAAWTLAEYFGGYLRSLDVDPALPPVKTFVAYMNRTAKRMGLSATHFTNPHGLPNPKNRSTATDVAVIGRAANEHPEIAEICRTPAYT